MGEPALKNTYCEPGPKGGTQLLLFPVEQQPPKGDVIHAKAPTPEEVKLNRRRLLDKKPKVPITDAAGKEVKPERDAILPTGELIPIIPASGVGLDESLGFIAQIPGEVLRQAAIIEYEKLPGGLLKPVVSLRGSWTRLTLQLPKRLGHNISYLQLKLLTLNIDPETDLPYIRSRRLTPMTTDIDLTSVIEHINEVEKLGYAFWTPERQKAWDWELCRRNPHAHVRKTQAARREKAEREGGQ